MYWWYILVFQTDPQNTDYALEAGATRNFEALRKAEILAEKELAEKEELEKNNPMKVRIPKLTLAFSTWVLA